MSQLTETGHRQEALEIGSHLVAAITSSAQVSLSSNTLFIILCLFTALLTRVIDADLLSTHESRCAYQPPSASTPARACYYIHPLRPPARYDSFLTSVVTASSICLSFRPAASPSAHLSHTRRGASPARFKIPQRGTIWLL